MFCVVDCCSGDYVGAFRSQCLCTDGSEEMEKRVFHVVAGFVHLCFVLLFCHPLSLLPISARAGNLVHPRHLEKFHGTASSASALRKWHSRALCPFLDVQLSSESETTKRPWIA